ncbi:MAG: hypothetical protein DRR16_01665 [Candidatus Parabeggiatoa sp. nov. 3]|nr:MAG: hypothetical protein DRR00_03950 [Gammaproteobacteria bacterium]RKZ68615.1 MAG: hypothetical protein DRQ99_03200 [Gammaproteobacteria bacterium]RKZ89823.1 MAG: hypothetical protein DRR16_01665 [Gammaproteobacteria bacterium]
MDHEILVKEFCQITKILNKEKGPISLLMLKAFDAQMNDWNLIVSAPAYDNLMLKTALTDLVTRFNKHLSQTISEQIIRSTILKTTDPFVKEINQVFKVTHTVKYVYSSVISGIYLEKAIIFESHSIKNA